MAIDDTPSAPAAASWIGGLFGSDTEGFGGMLGDFDRWGRGAGAKPGAGHDADTLAQARGALLMNVGAALMGASQRGMTGAQRAQALAGLGNAPAAYAATLDGAARRRFEGLRSQQLQQELDQESASLPALWRSVPEHLRPEKFRTAAGGGGASPAAPPAVAPGGVAPVPAVETAPLPAPGQGQPAAPGSPDFERRLIGSESGGRWGVVNREGYAGGYQFGTSRLAEMGFYRPAPGETMGGRNEDGTRQPNNQWRGTFAIPGFEQVRTREDFLANPDAQRAAFVEHVRRIDRTIADTPGADRFDRDGLRAVAHLGGEEGMRRFVSTAGGYNPQDGNRTTLAGYYTRFSGQPVPTPLPQGQTAGPGVPSGEAPRQVAPQAAPQAAPQVAPQQPAATEAPNPRVAHANTWYGQAGLTPEQAATILQMPKAVRQQILANVFASVAARKPIEVGSDAAGRSLWTPDPTAPTGYRMVPVAPAMQPAPQETGSDAAGRTTWLQRNGQWVPVGSTPAVPNLQFTAPTEDRPGYVFDPRTGAPAEVPGTAPALPGGLTQRQAARLDTLRTEMVGSNNRIVQGFEETQAGYRTILEQAKQGTGASDQTLGIGILKMLDPTSVASPGEVRSIAASAGITDRLWNGVIQRALNGETLTPEQRAQLINAAGVIYTTRAEAYGRTLERYRSAARDSIGIRNPEAHLPDARVAEFVRQAEEQNREFGARRRAEEVTAPQIRRMSLADLAKLQRDGVVQHLPPNLRGMVEQQLTALEGQAGGR